MANTVQNGNRIAWTYTTNAPLSVAYRVSAKQVYVEHVTDGTKYGGSAAASTVPHLPKGFRMRAVKCTSTGLPAQWLPFYGPTATLATAGTTVTRTNAGVDATYTSTGRIREESWPKWFGGITQAT